MADDWRAALPEDLRGEAMFKDIPDVATLAKVARDAKSALGASIRIPGPDAGDEARADFRAKLLKADPDLVQIPKDPEALGKLEGELFERFGRPKDAKEYALPTGVEIQDEVLEALRKEAAEEGLTKKQFAARAKRYADGVGKATQAEKDELALLKKELGEAFDERTAAARAIAEKLGVPKEALASMPARQLRVWANAAKAIGGDPRHLATQLQPSTKLTPSEQMARANEIRTRLLKEKMDNSTRSALITQLVELETAVATAMEAA